MTQENLQVTSLDDLNKYSKGVALELPAFAEGQPFIAMVKRPSMMVMMKTGKIPNSLMAQATKLFAGNNRIDADDEKAVSDMVDVLDIVADASLVQPTLKEIKGAGLELTDEQKVFLFNYSQRGVKYLESFRLQQENTGNNTDVKDVQVQA
jgi:hypothetical protein